MEGSAAADYAIAPLEESLILYRRVGDRTQEAWALPISRRLALPLATGLFKFCPAYSLLGINSCGMKT